MKVVIDANRVIAALLKDSTTRQILFNKNFKFIAPSFILSEIKKYKDYIIKKSKITEKEFEETFQQILPNVLGLIFKTLQKT